MKKIKGFTLVELIVVMAIFSMIAVGAMALVGPSLELFGNTSEQEDMTASSENVKRYIEDNIHYADYMLSCAGYADFNDIEATVTDGETTSEVPVLAYFKDLYFEDIDEEKLKNKIYVMEIDNGNQGVDTPMGLISIYNVDLSTGKLGSKVSELNEYYYEDYSFNINFGDPSEGGVYPGITDVKTEMYIDVFKRLDQPVDGKYFKDMGVKSDLYKHDMTSAMYFINLDVEEDTRFTFLKNPEADYSSKYYFVYTVPEIIPTA